MSNATFVEHLGFLNQLPDATVTSMYHTLLENQAWPEVEGVELNPLSVIVFACSALVQRLAPDIPPEDHVEFNILGQCLGMLLTQQAVAAIAVNVEAADIGLAEDLGLLVITEEEDGKAKSS